MTRFLTIFTALLIGSTTSLAQYTNLLEGGASQTVTNSWNISGTNVWVGNSTSSNTLDVVNGGIVTNFSTYIGNGTNSTYNRMTVSGTNASWVSEGNVFVGNEGSGNRLEILNGGTISNFNGYVGKGGSASNNTVLVSGDGSRWINTGSLYLGNPGVSNNTVTVTNGGLVAASELMIYTNNAFNLDKDGTLSVSGAFDGGQEGFNWNDGSTLIVQSNLTGLVTISGSDKTLTLDGGAWDLGTNALTVGSTGSDNLLTIQNGAMVTNANAFVGIGAGADSNSVLVTGSDSAWVSAGTLTIGATNNLGNSVTVANSGHVTVGGLVVKGDNDFNLAKDGTLTVGGAFDGGQEGFNWNDGSTLIVQSNLTGLVAISGSDKTLTLDGVGATWYDAAETNMTISGGAVVNVTNSAIAKAGNLAVQDAGSVLNVSSNAWMLVGDGSTTNPLALGGLMVASTNGAVLTVHDSASVNILETLRIGASNTLFGTVSVSNGGMITAGMLKIEDANSAFNLENDGTLKVTGGLDVSQPGFNWKDGGDLSVGGALSGMSNVLEGTNKVLTLDGGNWNEGAGDITVGLSGSSSVLEILNGGFATNANGYIGYNVSAENNSVIVSGSNSVWNNSGDLYVGYEGSANALTITAGGTVTNTDGYVGFTTNALNNTVVVSGSKSVWNNSGTLTIGAVSNAGNSVTVSGNGTVIAANLDVAADNSFVLDSGGTLRMTGDINLTNYTASTLNWKSGGNLSVGGSLEGKAATNLVVQGTTSTNTYLSSGRIVTIGGSDARWHNGGETNLIIGFTGNKSKLVVEDGGTVDNANGFVGWPGSAGNSVLVTGGGSTWTNRENLYVGGYPTSNGWAQAGNENGLTVADGGWVFVGDAVASDYAGFAAATNGTIAVAATNGAEMRIGNTATVETDTFFLGAGSSTGTVDVLNGGTLVVRNLQIANSNNTFNLAGTLNVVSNSFDATPGLGFNWENAGTLAMTDSDLFGVSEMGGSNKTVSIDGGSWSNSGALAINGYMSKLEVSSTSNNNSLVTSAGAVIGATTNDIGNTVSFSGSNSTWENAGELYVGDAGSGNTLTISDGAFVTNGNAVIGFASSASNNSVTVTGSNSLWSIGGNLSIGQAGTNNTLNILEQGTVMVAGSLVAQNGSTVQVASEGILSVATNMTVSGSSVSGDGTILLGSDLVDSTLFISGTNTMISSDVVFDGGGTNDFDTVAVNDWTFTVSTNTSNQYQNFEALELTQASLTGFGTFDAFDSVNMTGGVLEPVGGTLRLPENFTVSGQPLFKITADGINKLELTNVGAFDLSSLDTEVTIEDGLVGIQNFNREILTAEVGGLSSNFLNTTFNEGYLLYDFDLVYTNLNAVSVTAKAAVDGDLSSSLAYAGSEGIRAGFNGMQNAVFTRTKQLRRNVVATAHALPQEAFLLSNTNAPAGAMGPGDQNTIFDMHIWLQQFGGQGTYDAQGRSHGFTLNKSGTTIGADRLFGDALTAGFNYTYARSDARTTNSDTIDTETYWFGGYAEWVSIDGLYVDALLAYGKSDYNSVRIADNSYRGTAKYNGSEVGGYADVGQYYHYKNLALSPYLGLHVLSVSSEGYTENGPGGNDVEVDSARRSWVESAVGLKVRHRFDTRKGRFQTTGYAEWMHDFIQEDVESELSASGVGPVNTARISPDANVFGTGLGLSWIYTDYLEFGVGYNGRFSDGYEEHTGSIMFDIRF